MFDYLFCQDNDDKAVLFHNGESISLGAIKSIACRRAEYFSGQKKDIIFLNGSDTFSFIVDFIAAVISKKNMFLADDKFDFQSIKSFSSVENDRDVSQSDYKNIIINLCTSGSNGQQRIVRKSLFNLIREAEDIGKIFFQKEEKLRFCSTTSLNHLFGLTFHFMTPFVNGFVIDTRNVAYPEHLDYDESVLITTPSFLAKVHKYALKFNNVPKMIFAAGAKLSDELFSYFEKSSKVTEIYGSTEAGVIAYRNHSCESELTKFENVSIANFKDNILTIKSDYFYEDELKLSDFLKFEAPDKISVLERADRILKIGEKRIAPEKIERLLMQSPLVQDVYCFKSGEKLAAAVVLSEAAKNIYLESSQINVIKKLKNFLYEKSEIIPQKWRFLPEVYKTKSGKINKEKIEEIFASNISFPLVLNQKIGLNSAEIELIFPKHSNFFKGHFKNFPILPGVVELYFAAFFANTVFDEDVLVPQIIKKIKFSHTIYPNQKVVFVINNNEHSIGFVIKSDFGICASGVISKSKFFELK